MPRHESEVAMGRVLVPWLRAEGWQVYQEVPLGDRRCDVVATDGQLVYAVEMKRSLGLDVLAQAKWWRMYAHLAAVAVPRCTRRTDGHALAEQVAEWCGLGVLEVCDDDRVRVRRWPPLHRKVLPQLRQALRPEQEHYAEAGTNTRRAWTPFQATCHQLRGVVAADPGITLKAAVAAVQHHYASAAGARAHLATGIVQGLVLGVRIDAEGGKLRLYPAPPPAAAAQVLG